MGQSTCLFVSILTAYEFVCDATGISGKPDTMSFDHVFDQLDIATKPFAICEIYGSCHVALNPDAAVTLHYVLCGEGQITMRTQPPIRVTKGSLVLIPSLNSHTVLNAGDAFVPGPSCKPAALNLQRILKSVSDAEQSPSRLIALCAHVSIGLKGATDVVNLIREPLVAQVENSDVLSNLVDTLMREVSEPQVGSSALIRALLLQAVIAMLRDRLAAQDGAMDWMSVLRDPMIWKALRTMLDKPGDPHSVESLAEASGLSRAAFARRFAEAYGSGPMDLLRSLRIRKAGELLRTSELPIKRVAEVVGFSSRSAFSRTFEAISGQSPSVFRKQAKAS